MNLEGKANQGPIERAFDRVNWIMKNENYNTAFSFAISYLVSLIVYYEQVTDQKGDFNYEKLIADLKQYAEVGHAQSEGEKT